MDRLQPFHLASLNRNLINDTLFRSAMDFVSAPIIIFASDGAILWSNREFTITSGYSFSELVRRNIAAICERVGASAALLPHWPQRSPLALSDRSSARVAVRRADGSIFTADARVRAMESDSLAPCFVCVLQQATHAVQSLDQEIERTRTDPLTGAYSRTFLLESLRQAIQASGDNGHIVAALFVDLDGFKGVNDRHGHSVGDDLLRAVTSRLQSGVRASDVVGRYGGDEFVVVLPALAARQLATDIGRKLLEQLAQPFSLGWGTVRIGASVGVAFFPDHGNDVRTILMRADEAMYRGKRGGGGTVTIAENRCSLVSRGTVRFKPMQVAGLGGHP